MKVCRQCKVEKDISEFHRHQYTKDGHRSSCKICRKSVSVLYYKKYKNKILTASKVYLENNKERMAETAKKYYNKNKFTPEQRKKNREKAALRRARKLNATPIWINLKEIKYVYYNCPEDYHVDHIIPLKGNMVCGLHVPWNLQYLTAKENLQKSNKLLKEYI